MMGCHKDSMAGCHMGPVQVCRRKARHTLLVALLVLAASHRVRPQPSDRMIRQVARHCKE